jgi:hypothetical protein
VTVAARAAREAGPQAPGGAHLLRHEALIVSGEEPRLLLLPMLRQPALRAAEMHAWGVGLAARGHA